MTKPFLEVFPLLKLKKETESIFKLVNVERIGMNSEKTKMRIYINCNRLILRDKILEVRKAIQEQIFKKQEISIQIQEKYFLSKQYNPEKLMHIYRDSILMELKEKEPILYALFQNATIISKEDTLILSFRNTKSVESYVTYLIEILEKIFVERCGVLTKFEIVYAKEVLKKQSETIEEQMIAEKLAYLEKMKTNEDSQSATADNSLAGLIEEKASPKTENKKNSNSKKTKIRYREAKISSNPNVFYGRDFEEESIEIAEIQGEMGEVTIQGQVIHLNQRELRNEKTLIIFDITDFSDSITVKMFAKAEQKERIFSILKKEAFIKLKGMTMIDKYDGELSIGSIVGAKRIPDFTGTRMDYSPTKRVELHCHTKMSDMDAVSDIGTLIKRARKWGMSSLAITDHGNVQGFTEAFHVLKDVNQDEFKMIYGVEGYLVDDLNNIVENVKGQDFNANFVVFDIETTGFSPVQDRIIEIGAIKIVEGKIIDQFSSLINPEIPIPFRIEQLTGIKDSMVMDAPKIETVLEEFLDFCADAVLVAHNANFDVSFIKENERKLGKSVTHTSVDTLGIARFLFPRNAKHTLDALAKIMHVNLESHHRAVDDAKATADIFLKMIPLLRDKQIYELKEINDSVRIDSKVVSKLPSYHVIILAKNEIGRINLYRLISASHLEYFYKRPKIPKSLLMKYREGLIIGAACEAGEVFRAVVEEKLESQIANIVSFYDYLEVQPIGNNQFMISSERYPKVQSEKDLEELNRRIVSLGDKFKKPVVATCDVHFMDPEDEIYRRIIMSGRGFPDADQQPPLYFRTTDEMLEEFKYLGRQKAEEIVIINSNRIADQIEYIEPVRKDKCPPVIPDSDKTLTDICYRKAHELYGEKLPEIVENRLKKELNSIITNGFAVMYIIAQKLVWKSLEDGYLVGSRGSVGSSFVATMAGITEVNPLPPHYYCLHCHYSDFDSEEVKAFIGKAGVDMEDKLCPKCGEKLVKDGFDIPFETFLGFKGDKEPDIDLNFSGEYQSKAHKYTEVIFGAGQTYRAGTIGTLAEKTAFGYVKNYFEEKGIRKRTAEINRIVKGCTGIRRTTGQHPGGIIVLPLGEDINSFTPVQHPANDMNTDTITTHFDYHSIDHNLLKLDILGHDDPTMIRMLQDLTGIDPTQIPLDDPKVMSIFRNTEALGIRPEDIDGCKLGSLGIPEFGTDFVIQMLIDTKPESFSDLVRISGLSHGTDVWLGNAQTLIADGKATISTAICTRDDIMSYLIGKGVESSLSFTIMESVRKGKGLKSEWIEAMKEKNVPDWYIWSCQKIQYMFPKAHAAAYVMMAWRIAYCKVNYPLAYYTAYFSIRASAFSYEVMCQGKSHLESIMENFKLKADSLTKKEQDMLKDMRIVQEMYARGFQFVKLDIFKAHARLFQIIDGKIMPSLSSIEGLGEKAALAVMQAAKDGEYLSKDDFRKRTKVSKTAIELMETLDLLGDIPETNQLSLFDYQ